MKTEIEIVDGLIESCKTLPLPQDPLWQCFLESAKSAHPGVTVHPPPSTGMDGAKLPCCAKANTSTCRSVSIAFLSLLPICSLQGLAKQSVLPLAKVSWVWVRVCAF